MRKNVGMALIICLLVLGIPLPAQASFTSGFYLFSDDDKHVYLGKLTANEFDLESVYNEFGTYGNKFSSTSIFNKFGIYGSKYSAYSPFNPYALNPPVIIIFDDGKVSGGGILSCNTIFANALNPDGLEDVLKDLGV